MHQLSSLSMHCNHVGDTSQASSTDPPTEFLTQGVAGICTPSYSSWDADASGPGTTSEGHCLEHGLGLQVTFVF